MKKSKFGLYNHNLNKDNCGVGFITRKDTKQTHDLIIKADEALSAVPHRGGMSSQGVGDGAGISIDLSVDFFSKITSKKLKFNKFCVGNFFVSKQKDKSKLASDFIKNVMKEKGFEIIKSRYIPVNHSILNKFAISEQLPIMQFIFSLPNIASFKINKLIHECLNIIEEKAFSSSHLSELYPLSLSTKLQVLKGRLKSDQIISYFKDLHDKEHKIYSLYFHTRFSTNTDPHPFMAQPFRLIAHNGELNTNKKNIISENASYKSKNKKIIRFIGQSDSCRLDQTLQNRIYNDGFDLVSAVISMMPPAWENDLTLSEDIRSMFEYFSLYEEKNDGPAALIFGDGNIIGARLDRLGLRPLRTIETKEYVSAMSEAGQISFNEEDILSRGRLEAGGIFFYNHAEKKLYRTYEALKYLAAKFDYKKLLAKRRVNLNEIKIKDLKNIKNSKIFDYKKNLNLSARYVAYFHNQETFKFFMDPMIETGLEKVSAMGYGNAINALSDNEGGVAKYFSQKFAQVTNPPLDSIREADGMTLRVSLGSKSEFKKKINPQIVLNSPILKFEDLLKIKLQKFTPTQTFEILYEPNYDNSQLNEKLLENAIHNICSEINNFVRSGGEIIIISDLNVSDKKAVIPLIMVISAINQSLIENGLRFKSSIVAESGQISTSHHIACSLGFGASAVYPTSVQLRIEEKFSENSQEAYVKFIKASEKSLLKIMGKVGLCTVESYSGGEFFEPNFLDTNDEILKKFFPNMQSPVGGVKFKSIAQSTVDWHKRSKIVNDEKDIPILGLFKERSEGAGHSFGIAAVREFVDLTEEKIAFSPEDDAISQYFTINEHKQSFSIDDDGYVSSTFNYLPKKYKDNFLITSGYKKFSKMVHKERSTRPAALRDILDFPLDFTYLNTVEEFEVELKKFDFFGNINFLSKGISILKKSKNRFEIKFLDKRDNKKRYKNFLSAIKSVFPNQILNSSLYINKIDIKIEGTALKFFKNHIKAPKSIKLSEVQNATEIVKTFASGAMSHGALVSKAHEAVAHGTNMVGALSNCGEGGEHYSRFGTIRSSKIKQFASGRFGVWAGYLADPNLEEIEIKIGQGAKPGEGGQLPSSKVSVEIAAARGGVPGVELVSPPPHHDTYSIEDLAQLIHDAKAARVKVIVKLVSSDGIGTIAVGVAKAGADIINIAGGTGGTGAASVTSLKYTGRSAEIGLAEVNQALCANNIRQKVALRCSGAHQTGYDVIKSALLGGDSFEFGTSTMMMLKCVMAKNCNIKCPAGLTTNSELFKGDPRALAQYFLNVAHEVRQILAYLGFKSISEIRGKTDLLHLINHSSSVGQLNLKNMLKEICFVKNTDPVYLEKDFSYDDKFLNNFKKNISDDKRKYYEFNNITLSNRNKTFAGQFSIDIERLLNYEYKKNISHISFSNESGRKFLKPNTITINTNGSAGQSYGAFCNDGMTLKHKGTCNDGVGKSACGGEIIITSPNRKTPSLIENVLIGNFCLFGATGGRLFVEGQAGDRFAVRNSGATAVVEGVGDYCAEYMTNGTILNLGSFSRGYGNGMSGGFIYQYDPYQKIYDFISVDSVQVNCISDKSNLSKIQEKIILDLLNWHVNATNSAKAKYILNNWYSEKENFYYITPKSLLQYQDFEEILKSKSRKELIEELSTYMVTFQIKKIKNLWISGENIANGNIPSDKDTDYQKIQELINNWKIYQTAKDISAKNNRGSIVNENTLELDSKKLIFSQNFSLISNLMKYARDAISNYNNEELSVLISNKRINDFKDSLKLRNFVSIDGLGTYSWIIYQQRKNFQIMKNIPDYEELFFKSTLPSFV